MVSPVSRMLGRRLFARATMGVPLALKTVDGTTPEGAFSPRGLRPFSSGVEPETKFDLIWSAIHKATRVSRQQDQRSRRRAYLMGGLDPDISVLNSVATQHRIQMQIDRDQVRQERDNSITARIVRAMGGNPEDFE